MPSTPDTPMNERHHINVFTHNDLDGVACAVLAELYAKQKNASITVVYCTPSTVNQELKELESVIWTAQNMDTPLPAVREVFVLDLALDGHGADTMEWFLHNGCIVRHVDHHPMKTTYKHPWMTITSSPSICTCDMFISHLLNFHYATFDPGVNDFVSRVSIWDAHRFPPNEQEKYEDLNLVLKLLGPKDAQVFFTGALIEEPNQPIKIKDTYLGPAVEALGKREKEYCALHARNTLTFYHKGCHIEAVFADQFISEIADFVLDHHPDADICAVIQMPFCVSLRTRRTGINLYKMFAKPRGGHGNARAAAFPIKHHITAQLFSPIMEMDYLPF